MHPIRHSAAWKKDLATTKGTKFTKKKEKFYAICVHLRKFAVRSSFSVDHGITEGTALYFSPLFRELRVFVLKNSFWLRPTGALGPSWCNSLSAIGRRLPKILLVPKVTKDDYGAPNVYLEIFAT